MAFLGRLGWYLLGLSIGIVFLVFFLKKKSGENGMELCYFPNCRVLKDMRSKPVTFSEDFDAAKDSVLIKSFLTDGNIDFGKSDAKSDPCRTYYISKVVETGQMALIAKNCKNKVVVERIEQVD